MQKHASEVVKRWYHVHFQVQVLIEILLSLRQKCLLNFNSDSNSYHREKIPQRNVTI